LKRDQRRFSKEWPPFLPMPSLPSGKIRRVHRRSEPGGAVLFQRVQVVQPAQEEQIGDLLDHLERVGDAAGPEGVPDLVDLALDVAGDHEEMLRMVVSLSLGGMLAFAEVPKRASRGDQHPYRGRQGPVDPEHHGCRGPLLVQEEQRL
jgi:hypothetical protein